MKKLRKKLVSLLCAAALVVPMATAPAIDAVAEETFAYLMFAAADWGVQTWDGVDEDGVSVVNASVDGSGSYSVGLNFDEPVDGFAFSALVIADGTNLYPGASVTIDAIRVNGDAIDFGSTYTADEDGHTRVNLYNEWVDAIPDGARFAASDASPTPVDNTIDGISSLEVDFTLEVPVAEVSILYAAGDWAVSYWGGDADPGVTVTNAIVSGDGTYTVSAEFDPPGSGMAFFAVAIEAGQFLFPNKFMQIDSVLINGEAVDVGDTYSNLESGALRTNLYNEWVDEVGDGITLSGELGNATPTPVSNDVGEVSSIEVTFTLMDGIAFGGGDEEEYEPPSEFNAFMMFQDNGSGGWSNFAPGVGNDMTILGDGVWEVSITRDQAGGDGQAEPDDSNGLVFLVDIEGLGRAMAHVGTLWEADTGGMTGTSAEVSVEVFVDGEAVPNVRNENIKVGDIEGNGRLRLELVNFWGTGTIDNPVVVPSRLNPNDEIKVVFTLKGTGFNSDFDWDALAAVEEPPAPAADPTPAPAPAPAPAPVDDGDNAMLFIIIGAVVAVALVVVLVVVMKKKKGGKADE